MFVIMLACYSVVNTVIVCILVLMAPSMAISCTCVTSLFIKTLSYQYGWLTIYATGGWKACQLTLLFLQAQQDSSGCRAANHRCTGNRAQHARLDVGL